MTASSAKQTLILNRVFKAPIETVYEAWTNAEILAKWFGPEEFKVLKAQSNVIVGGKYEIVIESPDGKIIKHYGEYLSVAVPQTLVFTWVLKDQDCAGSENQQAITLVSLEFKETDEGTQLTLIHEKLPDQAACDGHRFGWESSFNSLNNHLTPR